MSNILYISSEAFPLIKTGGLGDVAGSLPAALLKQSQQVRLLLPAYPEVMAKIKNPEIIAQTTYFHQPVNIIASRLPGSRVVVWLVDCPSAFNRPGGPYTDEQGKPWKDNALRFAIFCHAATDIALNNLATHWPVDIVHCNDWQSALVPALLSLQPNRPASVFTVHNLAYQGVFNQQTFHDLHLPDTLWSMQGVEFYGQFSFIKGGLAYADKITTVSPQYAKEILTAENGYGLDGLLKHRQQDISGIINGIDEKYWNPGTDSHLVQKYNRRSLSKKVMNKTALQKELSLPVNAAIPMIGMVSRLVEQKGLDLIIQCMVSLLDRNLQLVILGTGEPHYESRLLALSQQYPTHLNIIIGYNEQLAHRIEAASDLYLMPSIFEPCGLNQLYSLAYASLPIVTAVGGLANTVTHASRENIKNNTANGFVLDKKSPEALISTIDYALSLYKEPALWRKIQLNAMAGDFSWKISAEHYIELYQQLLETDEKCIAHEQ